MPIVETISWPSQKDTHRGFWWAENVANEVSPAAPGQTVKQSVGSLPSGKTIYFAVKSYDRANNISKLSNVVSIRVP